MTSYFLLIFKRSYFIIWFNNMCIIIKWSLKWMNFMHYIYTARILLLYKRFYTLPKDYLSIHEHHLMYIQSHKYYPGFYQVPLYLDKQILLTCPNYISLGPHRPDALRMAHLNYSVKSLLYKYL